MYSTWTVPPDTFVTDFASTVFCQARSIATYGIFILLLVFFVCYLLHGSLLSATSMLLYQIFCLHH